MVFGKRGLYLHNRFISVTNSVDGGFDSAKFLFLLVCSLTWALSDYHPVAGPIFFFVAGCCLVFSIILLLVGNHQKYYYL